MKEKMKYCKKSDVFRGEHIHTFLMRIIILYMSTGAWWIHWLGYFKCAKCESRVFLTMPLRLCGSKRHNPTISIG